MLQVKPKNFDKFRWISLIAGTIMISSCSWGYTWSLIVDPMIAERGASDAFMATCYSTMTLTGMLFTVIGGKLIDKIGPTKANLISMACYLLGMVVCGLTHALWAFMVANVVLITVQQSVLYISVQATAESSFPDHRGLALGITTAGISLGGMIMAPVTQSVMDAVGFDNMFIVMGIGITVMVCVCMLVNPDTPKDYKPAGLDEALSAESETPKRMVANPSFKAKTTGQMLKDPVFYMLFAIPLLCTTGYMLLGYQMSYIAQDILGISKMEAAFLVSGVSACGFAAKLIGGFLGDLFGRLRWTIVILAVGTVAIAGLIFSADHGIAWFAVCCFVYCFCMGSWAGMTSALTGDLFGSEHFSGNFSVVYISVLAASTISPWLAVVGRTAGETVNYAPIFTLCTVMCAVGTVLAILLYIMRGKKTEYIPRPKGEQAAAVAAASDSKAASGE